MYAGIKRDEKDRDLDIMQPVTTGKGRDKQIIYYLILDGNIMKTKIDFDTLSELGLKRLSLTEITLAKAVQYRHPF